MLVLLPPSEGKTAPARGKRLDLAGLVHAAELTAPRVGLLDALQRLGDEPLGRAVEALGISPGQADEVALDTVLRSAPTAAAADLYSGVLYDRLGLPELPAKARRRVLIASALWGVVRAEDRIPYYRFSAKARLPGIGPLASYWRQPLAAALPDRAGSLVVDMRSAAYAAAWKPRRATLLAVRAFAERGGERKPVSHMAKAIRGEIARALLLSPRQPRDPAAAAAIAEAAGFRVELTPGSLDVIVAP